MEYRPKIKLCGMMQAQDVICASGLNADYVGFILTKGYKRTVSSDTFFELEKLLRQSFSQKVGVFVNEAIESIINLYEEKLDLIFDDFYSLSTNQDRKRSHGLGLSICKTIVEAHGGTIKAENNDLGGCTFSFTIRDKEE